MSLKASAWLSKIRTLVLSWCLWENQGVGTFLSHLLSCQTVKINNMAFNQPGDSKNVTLNVKVLQLKEVLITILWFARSNHFNLNANHHVQIKGYKQWGDTFTSFLPSWVSKIIKKSMYNDNYEFIRHQYEDAVDMKNKKLYMVSVNFGDSNFKWKNWKTGRLETIGSG